MDAAVILNPGLLESHCHASEVPAASMSSAPLTSYTLEPGRRNLVQGFRSRAGSFISLRKGDEGAGLACSQRGRANRGRQWRAERQYRGTMASHGLSGYNAGCRCPVCTGANTSRLRRL